MVLNCFEKQDSVNGSLAGGIAGLFYSGIMVVFLNNDEKGGKSDIFVVIVVD